MKFFIASPWRNKDIVKDLTEAIIAQGHTAYSFLDNGANPIAGSSVVEKSEEFEENFTASIKDWDNNPVIRQIFDFDMQALKESDIVILLEPAGRSSLTEGGIAYGMGKKVVLIGQVNHPEVVVYCICESRYASVEEFLKSLSTPT